MTVRMLSLAWVWTVAAGLLLFTGCQSAPGGPGTVDGQPAAQATPEDAPVDPDAAAMQQAADTAREMARQMDVAAERASAPPLEILWLTPDVQRDTDTVIRPDDAQPTPPPRPEPSVSTAVEPSPTIDATVATTPSPDPGPIAPSRQELLDLLLTDLRRSDDPAMQRAMQAATLSVIDPRYSLDETILAALPASRRDAVRRYHDLLKALHSGLAGNGGLDREQLAAELYDVLGPMPIDITNLQPCTRVQGFGVYTAFPDHRFIAGRPHRMIVYAELEHFTSGPTESGGHEVKLTQELELYDDAGLLVWKQDAVAITDRSANRRRDVFTVQMIELPARLTVGKFALKIRVIDDATGNRAERSADIEIVADQSLVNR